MYKIQTILTKLPNSPGRNRPLGAARRICGDLLGGGQGVVPEGGAGAGEAHGRRYAAVQTSLARRKQD